MDIYEMRKKLGYTQKEFANRYDIPFRTIQNWENGIRKPPEYVLKLLEYKIQEDLINRKTIILPKFDSSKLNLPKRSDFIGTISWLKAINNCVKEPIVFALDEALMCQGNFLGRNEEDIIYLYGNDSLTRFNGVVVLSNQISSNYVEEKNGLKYTNFNRTILDALANESILDMQGIIEAINKYCCSNENNINDLFIEPKYQVKFQKLLNDAKQYYES